MSLTQCPDCRCRCFTDAAFCQGCLQTFSPGVLWAYAIAEEKSFSLKMNMMFLTLFLMWLAILAYFQLQAFLAGTGN
jgi:hypothetical protein